MLLTVGVLIIAQGATLFLTLAFPPQPPAQHSLEDIARTLRGQTVQAQNARPLIRQIVDHPPHAEGPGWLSAEGPRDRLATLLQADASDVVLMFYVPLPAGAQALAPQATTPRSKPSSDAPASPREPRIVAAAFLPVFSSGPMLVRNRPSVLGSTGQTAPFLGSTGSRRQPGGFADAPRQGWNSNSTPLTGADRESRRAPWAGGQNHLLAPGVAPVVRTPGGEAARLTVRPGDGSALTPGGVGIGRAMAAALVARRNAASPSFGVLTTTLISTSAPASSAPPTASSPAATPSPPKDSPVSAPSASTPSAAVVQGEASQPEAAQSAPAPVVAKAPLAEPAALVPTQAAAASPARRGLFAPPPAGYIEGDFIAAQRIGDRWIVVKPRPEGFPTAWQSRVMLWFALSFLLVAPLGWMFSRRLAAPLRSFADAAERLGRDPSAPATVQGGSAEIARAAAAFNLMQTRLKRYVEDRTAMIGAISHDLRTPLTRMRFRVEAAPETLKPGLRSDMDQMEAMIASVLTFMRDQAEGGARERLDLRALLDEAVQNAVAGGADVAIEPGEPIEVQADALALNRVFANLLDNAVKYGGRAVVRLDRDGAEAIATVRDFGPGLPESELERVFKPFYRAPHAVAANAEGMGLGLANSRSIILAHGGAIQLTSQDGLTAEVRLPAAA